MSIKSTVPKCDRVGIWLFHSDYSAMFSLMCVDEFGKRSTSAHLIESDYKNYFSHIVENDFLVACDARNDEVAKCFNHGYFDVHNIHSLLDVTFNKDFVPLGIICCERTGNKTKWQPQDIKTIKNIAVKASLFIGHNISDMYASKPQ